MVMKVTKTTTMVCLHVAVGVGVAYALTGSLAISGAVALIEPVVNVMAVSLHERAWNRIMAWRAQTKERAARKEAGGNRVGWAAVSG